MNKKGMEMEELVKVFLYVFLLIVVLGIAGIYLSGKGGQIVDFIRNFLRFGR